MTICRVVGDVVSTQKNPRFESHRLLVVQPVELDRSTPVGSSMIAVDIVDAGDGDLVLVNKEGSSARLLLDDEQIPVQAVIVAVIDDFEVVE